MDMRLVSSYVISFFKDYVICNKIHPLYFTNAEKKNTKLQKINFAGNIFIKMLSLTKN